VGPGTVAVGRQGQVERLVELVACQSRLRLGQPRAYGRRVVLAARVELEQRLERHAPDVAGAAHVPRLTFSLSSGRRVDAAAGGARPVRASRTERAASRAAFIASVPLLP